MKRALKKFMICLLLPVIFSAGCRKASESEYEEPETEAETETQTQKPKPKEKTAAEKLLANMSLDEKICQLFFVKPEELTGGETVLSADEAVKTSLEAYPVGGIIYFARNLEERQQTIDMIKGTEEFSDIPLFIGVDEEGGIVARVSGNPAMGTTAFPPMAEIGSTGNTDLAYEAGATIASDISALGFNVDFAPVADIITNPNNTEIGNRSFSSDPVICSEMVGAAVRGIQSKDVSACCKHFPGHGSTEANSHTGYAESSRTLDELRETEFKPFEAGIEAGTDFIMVSHMTAVNIDSVPCSLSEIIISTLKNELRYSGIVITDAQDMQAVTDFYTPGEAAVKALKAGADMILMPAELSAAVSGVREAVENGELSESEIDEKVLKILSLKEKRGLIS